LVPNSDAGSSRTGTTVVTLNVDPPSMDRVMVVGTSCSGKTTLAMRMAGVMDAPHVELDSLHWGPSWTEPPLEEFRKTVARTVEADRWVVDGNYGKVRDIVTARATDAVWLDYPFMLVFGRALKRTVKRIAGRKELWAGNRETFRGAFMSRTSILLWVIRTHRRHRRLYPVLFGPDSGVRLHRLRRPRDGDNLVRAITAGRTEEDGFDLPVEETHDRGTLDSALHRSHPEGAQ